MRPARRWLLYVEDNEDDVVLVRETLPRSLYPVSWARDAADGRRRLAQVRYDLLLLDHGLPDMNGLLFLEEVRRSHPDLPVVFLTHRTDDALALAALQKGAAAVVAKDGMKDRLATEIERAFAAGRGAAGAAPASAPAVAGRAERLHELLLATMRDGCLVVDAQGVVTYANAAAGEMAGSAPGALLGRRVADLLDAPTADRLLAPLRAAATAAEAAAFPSFEGRLVGPAGSGRDVPVQVSARVLRTPGAPEGGAEGLLVVLTDVSELVEARNTLRARVAELERFQRFLIDRERRVIELKARLREYERRLGIEAPGLSDETRRDLARRLGRPRRGGGTAEAT